MKEIHIIRTQYQEKQTLGNLFVIEGTKILFQCKTLELPWLQNERRTSCIPAGTYPIQFEYSAKFNMKLWELKKVPNRSEVKIHAANYFTQILGCIALGDQHIYINGDEYKDVRSSRKTIDKFHKIMTDISKSMIHIHGVN